MGLSQTAASSYAGDPSTNSPRDLDLDSPPRPETGQGRHTLQKYQGTNDNDSFKGRKRFSKRQSKSGLAAVF